MWDNAYAGHTLTDEFPEILPILDLAAEAGNPMDYEKWAKNPGMENWDFAHCLPYFNRMENAAAAEDNDPRAW